VVLELRPRPAWPRPLRGPPRLPVALPPTVGCPPAVPPRRATPDRPPPAAARHLVRRARGTALPGDPAERRHRRRRGRLPLARARVPAAGLAASHRPGVCRSLAYAAAACPPRCRHVESRPGGERGVRGRSGGTRRDDARRVARDP